MPRFKDQAICIRQIDWSETSQVVILLCAERGKLRGLAKGSKRTSPSSVQRYSGGIELLTAGQIVATTKPTAELATITEWDLQNDYFALRHNLRAQQLAMYAADLVHALLADNDPHPRVFTLLEQFLSALCQNPSAQETEDADLLRFQWGLLADAGFKPQLHDDVETDEPLPDLAAYTFDPQAGGLTARNGLDDWRVRKTTVQLLQNIEQNHDIQLKQNHSIKRANRLLCVYARFILDKQLPTMPLVLGS